MVAHPPDEHSPDYRDAMALYRTLTFEEIGALADSIAYQLAAIQEQYSPFYDVELYRLTEQSKAISDDIARRERLYSAGYDVPDPAAIEYEQWRELAELVRDRASILDVAESAGWPLSYAGKNKRRNCKEYAGACIACGGTDRFRVWTGPPGGYWCRQCGISGDVITFYRNVITPDFFEAVRDLARQCGFAAPTPKTRKLPRLVVTA